MSRLTRILSEIDQADGQASARLLPLVYDELRRLAGQLMARERPGQTLNPTALVHEAYLKLTGGEGPRRWEGRHHFYRAASGVRNFHTVPCRRVPSHAQAGNAEPVRVRPTEGRPSGRRGDR